MKVRAVGNLRSVSIEEFIAAIDRLRPDQGYSRRDNSYFGTTKDQWLGWLESYNSPGYYGRRGANYDAKFAYNHIQNHQMLIWLLASAGLDAPTLSRAASDAEEGKNMAQRAAAVRRLVPWDRAVELLWPNGLPHQK